MAEAINSARAAVSAGVRPFHTKREERRRAQTTPLVFFPFLRLAHCESLSERSGGRLECSGCKRFSTADELLRLARPSGFFLPSPSKPLLGRAPREWTRSILGALAFSRLATGNSSDRWILSMGPSLCLLSFPSSFVFSTGAVRRLLLQWATGILCQPAKRPVKPDRFPLTSQHLQCLSASVTFRSSFQRLAINSLHIPFAHVTSGCTCYTACFLTTSNLRRSLSPCRESCETIWKAGLSDMARLNDERRRCNASRDKRRALMRRLSS